MFHPLRLQLHNEAHARPSLYFDTPGFVVHVAHLTKEPFAAVFESVARTAPDQRHGLFALDGCRIKWEQHTEFASLTVLLPPGTMRRDDAPERVRAFMDALPGQRIAAIEVRVISAAAPEAEKGFDHLKDPVVSDLGGGDATVRSDFRLSADGFSSFVIENRRLNAYRTGRMVRRLLEIETYRIMALFGLPEARKAGELLARFDAQVQDILRQLTVQPGSQDRELLNRITALNSEGMTAFSGPLDRFSATAAYARLVRQRIAELREGRVEGYQRLGVFVERRFDPAVQTCATTEQRIDKFFRRLDRASDLLRTQVQVQLEEQNASLLASMDERTRAQTKIQQAVEGLSVVALTYYALGILKLVTDSSQKFLPGVNFSILTLLSVPVFFGGAYLIIRRIKKGFDH